MISSPIQTIIIDDNKQERELLVHSVEEHPSLRLMGVYASTTAAHKQIIEGNVDLILMEIGLPDAHGLDFVRYLVKPHYIVFITKLRDYAVESYDLNVVDYIVKPLITERFLQAIEKVCQKKWQMNGAERPFFYVKDNSHFVKIERDTILYLKAMENYTQIVTPQRTHTVLMRLATLEKQLPPSVFLRANRSYIVNASKIEAISKIEIIISEHQIPLTRTYSEAIFDKFINAHLIKHNG